MRTLLAVAALIVPGVVFGQTPLGVNELARAKSMLEAYKAQLSAEQYAELSGKLAQTEQAYVELAELTGEAAATAAETGAVAAGGRAFLGGVAEVLGLLAFAWPSTAHAPGMKEEKPAVRAARAKLEKSVEELNAATRKVQEERAAAAKRPQRKRVVLDDDTPCTLRGGQTVQKPLTCRYTCDGVADFIEIQLPYSADRCPGDGDSPRKWKEIKRFPQRL